MNDSPMQEGEGALAVDILIEAEAWRMLPEAEDIVRRAIACALASGVEIRHPHPSLSPVSAGVSPALRTALRR
jgi:hypothetical protein